MSKAPAKIILTQSQDIPFNKLVLSQSNVRRVKAGLSIEELAEDIARRGLLQGLSVRPVLDAQDAPTGMYEVPAGGRRFRALQRLVEQKRMIKTQPVPCIVRTGGIAEEDSLAENVHRVALHPLDQFRAFANLREQGLSEDEIAARFFVTPAVVRQRLKLASVSPKLLELYAGDALDLEQLMAFTVTNDHARQEQVCDAVSRGYGVNAWQIRRQLTEGAVASTDKRARFVGLEAYEAAGGTVTRDLFDQDQTGWLQDPALLDRLALEKLARAADELRGEGWKWIEAAIEFPYGHAQGLRRLQGAQTPLSDEDQARCDALVAEQEELEAAHEAAEELPEEVDARLGAIETALAAFEDRPVQFDPVAITRAGAFVSLDAHGGLRIERGFVRRENEAPSVPEDRPHATSQPDDDRANVVRILDGRPATKDNADDTDEGVKPLPDRLVAELTACRTLALRDALARDPDVAFLAVLHALCLYAFYRFGHHTCLELTLRSTSFGEHGAALNDTAAAKAIEERHAQWQKELPAQASDLWDSLSGFDRARRAALFAHCASLSINAVKLTCNAPAERITHADQVARAVGLDMVAAGWSPSVENYLGRVTKAQILDAVREARGEASAQLLDHLKKADMAREAERLLAGTGWLPEPLRLVQLEDRAAQADAALPAFLTGGEAALDPEDEGAAAP
jgi:ParB family chromosome partitioning protein